MSPERVRAYVREVVGANIRSKRDRITSGFLVCVRTRLAICKTRRRRWYVELLNGRSRPAVLSAVRIIERLMSLQPWEPFNVVLGTKGTIRRGVESRQFLVMSGTRQFAVPDEAFRDVLSRLGKRRLGFGFGNRRLGSRCCVSGRRTVAFTAAAACFSAT